MVIDLLEYILTALLHVIFSGGVAHASCAPPLDQNMPEKQLVSLLTYRCIKMASSCADNILVIGLLHYVNFVIVISHYCTCICSTNHGHTKLYSLLGKFSKIKFTKSWSFICHSYNDN